MELQEAGETVTNQMKMKRTFAQVLKEENYKALRKEQEQKRKEQATTKQKASASVAKDRTFEEIMDFCEGNKDLDSQKNQDKDEVVNKQSMDSFSGFSGDWAADSVKSSEDPLYKTQQELDNSEEEEDDNALVPHGKRAPSYTPVKAPPSKVSKPQVESEYSDEDDEDNEDNFFGFSSSPPSSPLVEVSPSKVGVQSESLTPDQLADEGSDGRTTPGQSVPERELQIQFLPSNDCHV